MTSVVTLKTRAVQTNEATIKIMKDYLEAAEKGEIVSVAIAAIEPDGSSRTQCSESDHFQGLLGALTILQHRMISQSQ